MEILGLSILALLAVLMLVLGFFAFKLNPLVGFIAGASVFLILLGVVLSAFGGVGFIDSLLNSAWFRYVAVGASSYVVGTALGAVF